MKKVETTTEAAIFSNTMLSVTTLRYPNEPRTEFLDKIKLSNGRTIERYRHYFSGKMEIIEVSVGSYT